MQTFLTGLKGYIIPLSCKSNIREHELRNSLQSLARALRLIIDKVIRRFAGSQLGTASI